MGWEPPVVKEAVGCYVSMKAPIVSGRSHKLSLQRSVREKVNWARRASQASEVGWRPVFLALYSHELHEAPNNTIVIPPNIRLPLQPPSLDFQDSTRIPQQGGILGWLGQSSQLMLFNLDGSFPFYGEFLSAGFQCSTRVNC